MAKSLSLITPVFNEPQIHKHLPVIDQELKKTGLHYEIIAVNDGSDAITTTRLNSISLPNLRVYTYATNQGKGFALRYGFEISSGDIICFMDADLQLHPKQIALFTNIMELFNTDIVIGSKRHPLSQVEYGPQRKLYSWVYQQLVRVFFNLNITDTQVGLKLFKRHVLKEVVPRLVVKQYAFDLELLVVANHLGFTRIIEAPVHLTWNTGASNINWKVIPKMLQDTLAIFYRKNILLHYSQEKAVELPQKQPMIETSSKTQEISRLEDQQLVPRVNLKPDLALIKKTQPTNQKTDNRKLTPLEEPALEKPITRPLTQGVIFSAE